MATLIDTYCHLLSSIHRACIERLLLPIRRVFVGYLKKLSASSPVFKRPSSFSLFI